MTREHEPALDARGLTDLYNHRHVMELVSVEFSRVGRYQESFSVLMIDGSIKNVHQIEEQGVGSHPVASAAFLKL